MENLLWITNQPKSIKSLWPRRIGVEYIEGPPKSTEAYSTEDLIKQNLVGIYVRIGEKEYRSLPLARNQAELKVYENSNNVSFPKRRTCSSDNV